MQTDGLKSSIQKWLTKLNIFKHIPTYILDLTPVDIRCETIPWDITFYPPFRKFRPRNSLGFPSFVHPILIEPEFCPQILFPGLPLPSIAHHPIWSRVGSDTTCNDPTQVQTDGLKSSIQKWLIKLNIFKHITTYILDHTPVDIRCETIPWDITADAKAPG